MFCLFVLSFLLIFSSACSASEDMNHSTTSHISSTIEKNVVDSDNQNVKGNEKISKTIHMDSTNFDEYVTNGKLNENVSDGDTIDIQGKLDSPRFALEVDKAVNIVSSTNDAYIYLHTSSQGSYGEYKNGIFQVTKQGAGTNITGITFYNTRVSIENTSNIMINNISLINEHASIGMGVGAMTIREGSENITVSNSYFKTRNNGGHSNVVFAAAYNCLFENNTIEGYRSENPTSIEGIGNLLYLTTYNIKYATPATNINITIRNNTIRSTNVPSSMAICYGLCLEGSGHIIENNYIDTNYPVMAQYADASYGTETNIDEIIFNNNTIVRGNPQLIFPGTVTNNTFGEKATLNKVKAYNNIFKNVTITNSTVFENNYAQNLLIEGNNNTISNNEVYSDEDYAVKVTGENNTLSNNKFAGYLGRGEITIQNSTEITSINNSEDINRIYVFNDENWEKYMTLTTKTYKTNGTFLKSNDTVILNITDDGVHHTLDVPSLLKTDSLNVITNNLAVQTNAILVIINSTITIEDAQSTSGSKNITLINSAISRIQYAPISINSSVFTSSKFITNTDHYVLTDAMIESNNEKHIRITDEGFINLPAYSPLDVYKYVRFQGGGTLNIFKDNLYLNIPLTMSNVGDITGLIDTNFSFIDGSEYTTVENIIFNKSVKINSKFITFNNCTFNADVEVNNESIILNNNIFNGKVSLNNANKLIFNNNTVNYVELPLNITNSNQMVIENNTITTNADNTIIFDDESNSNTVKNNQLKANVLLGDETVFGGDNTVEDNGIAYNTNISISCDNYLFIGDKSDVTVTVFNTFNNTPVDKGYVEVYLDGILQGTKQLINGQVTLEINTDKISMGTVPLKVWYYEGIRYENNVTSINVEVVKSNVSIIMDDFTAKLNEKTNTNITFLNQKGNHVQDTNVTVTVGRTNYNLETTDGIATLNELVTREWLDAGKITITFPKSEIYNVNTTIFTLNTAKDDIQLVPEVSVTGNSAEITLTLTDSIGEKVNDGRINITTLDGQQLASGRVSNGIFTATFTIPSGYTSDYVMVIYNNSYYYNDLERQVKLSQMLNTSVTVNSNGPVLGEDLIVTGKLTGTNGANISGAILDISVNGEKTSTTTTDSNGDYNYTMIPGEGEYTVVVTFAGNIDYYGTSGNVTVNVLNVSREIKDLMDQIEELQKENDELKDENVNLSQELNEANNLIKDLNQSNNNLTRANNELSQQLADTNNKLDNLTNANKDLTNKLNNANNKIDTLTKNNADLTKQLADTNKKLNDLTKQVENLNKQLENNQKQIKDLNKTITEKDNKIKELTTKKNTKITVNKINTTKYGNDVTITGTLTDNTGAVLANMPVSVKINNAETKVVTNSKGTYTLTKTTNTVGTNNVTVSFAATDKYNKASAKATFKVDKQNVKVTLNKINTAKFKDSITITGTLMDANSKVLASTEVSLKINNKTVKVKTAKDGLFTYTTTASSMGTNNVTATYNGNAKYNKATGKATFKVNKQDLVLTVDRVSSSVLYKDNIEISGKLVDGNGKAIGNTIVSVKVNNKTYKAKTDKNGVYVLKLRATEMGTNNITVSYKGNTKYNKASAKTSFKVNKQDLIIGFNSVTYKNGKVTVSGTFTDRNRHALMNSLTKVTINGKTGNAKTDTNGTFTYTTSAKAGKIQLTLAYPGNARYNAYSKTSIIDVS